MGTGVTSVLCMNGRNKPHGHIDPGRLERVKLHFSCFICVCDLTRIFLSSFREILGTKFHCLYGRRALLMKHFPKNDYRQVKYHPIG